MLVKGGSQTKQRQMTEGTAVTILKGNSQSEPQNKAAPIPCNINIQKKVEIKKEKRKVQGKMENKSGIYKVKG
jgi:hypothetical protein